MDKTESKGQPSSSAAPVAKTATRKAPRQLQPRQGTRYPSQNPVLQKEVANRRAAGESYSQISKSLDVSTGVVETIVRLPEVQQQIASLREKYRLVAQERGVQTAHKMWDKLDEAVANDEAKKANLYSFGLSALDRISHNTSGEKQKVEVSGVPGDSNPRVEVRNLLVQIFGEPKPLSGN